jgi:hypothetical protein
MEQEPCQSGFTTFLLRRSNFANRQGSRDFAARVLRRAAVQHEGTAPGSDHLIKDGISAIFMISAFS